MAVLLAFLVLGVDLQGGGNPLPGLIDFLPGFFHANAYLGFLGFAGLAWMLLKIPMKSVRRNGELGVRVD